MVADVNQLSLNQYLMRQLTQPLRFGRYDDIIELTQPLRFGRYDDVIKGSTQRGPGPVQLEFANPSIKIYLPGSSKGALGTTQGGPGPVQGAFANATVQVYLPGSSKGSVVTLPPVTCGNACYMWRTYARTVALGRKKMAEEAEAELNLLVANQCMSDSDLAMNVSIVLKQKQTIVSGAVNTLDLNSSTASGTLTIDNSAAVYGVVMYMAAAEVQMAQEDPSYEELGLTTITLAKASALQDIMYYDEPAPFYYNVGETLAGWLMQQQEYDSAINYLRKTLFQWPRSALPTVALSEAMSNTPDADLYASAMTQLVAAATQLNDTNACWESPLGLFGPSPARLDFNEDIHIQGPPIGDMIVCIVQGLRYCTKPSMPLPVAVIARRIACTITIGSMPCKEDASAKQGRRVPGG
eukprot:gene17153-23463_t